MGTRRLTLLRHGQAQSVEPDAEDFERPLTRRGLVEAREMATRIVRRRMIPDLILVSPADRTWSTAEILAAACEIDLSAVQCARELYLATPESTWQLLERQSAALRHILICGHNPGLSELASRFGPKPQRRVLPTGGLASAVWYAQGWEMLEPELAVKCEMDDPERMGD